MTIFHSPSRPAAIQGDRASVITELCRTAGMPDAAAEHIASGKSPGDVAIALLKAQADPQTQASADPDAFWDRVVAREAAGQGFPGRGH